MLLDALGFEPTSADALIASTGLSSTSVASLLLALELEGRIVSDASGRYFRPMATTPTPRPDTDLGPTPTART
jgi:DNA processing protein